MQQGQEQPARGATMRQHDPAHPGRPPDDPTTTTGSPVDLDEAQRLCDEAIAESGPWNVAAGVDGGGGEEGIFVDVAGTLSPPGRAAAAFIRESREREVRLVAELRAAREHIETLISAVERRDAELDLAREVVREAWTFFDLNQVVDDVGLRAALDAYDKAMGGERP